jgi:hypothetical protein
MLSYECPDLYQIKIIGYVRGLEDVIYRAELQAQNNWILAVYNRAPLSADEYDG